MKLNVKKFNEAVLKRIKETMGSANPELQKAVEADVRSLFEDIEMVDDVWNQGAEGQHGVPNKKEWQVGPTEAASGGGASRMVREYSDFAPQSGITAEFERINSMFGEYRKAIKGIASQVEAHGEAIKSVLDLLSKAEKEEEKKEEKSEDGEDMEKARLYTKKAKSAIMKAEDEEEDKEERKEEVEKARMYAKKAKVVLFKAHEEAKEEEEEEKVEKALSDLKKLSKRITEIEASIKSEEEKKEEKKEEKAEEKAEDKEEKEEVKKENQDEWASSASTVKGDSVSKSEIADIARVTVTDLIDRILGQSNGSKVDLRKANITPAIEVAAGRIEDGFDKGTLREGDVSIAKSILLKLDMASKGVMDYTVVRDAIDKSPASVREIFDTV